MSHWPKFLKPKRADPEMRQLEFPLARSPEPDRNFAHGGRSFYFFDFDENVAFLTTPMYLFHRATKMAVPISSREFVRQSSCIGKSGPFADYEIDLNPENGSFQHFRDKNFTWLDQVLGRRQMFVQDLAAALGQPELQWKGPSWSCFYHAVFNSRPLALITARGHHPDTIQDGIRMWVKEGHLPHEPNYLAIYPVSHPELKMKLCPENSESIPHLKQKALRAAVLRALEIYGNNPHHRFGMSDDDPRNIEWIVREMQQLKSEFPQMSFFIIQTHGEQMLKSEVFASHVEDQVVQPSDQLTLFNEE
jgi:hypothetical protein